MGPAIARARKRLLVGAACLLLTAPLVAAPRPDDPRLSRPAFLATVTIDDLRMRERPTTQDSPVLLFLDAGDEVTVLERTRSRETIGGQREFWYRVRIAGAAGWVFGGFLRFPPDGPSADLVPVDSGF